MHCAACWEHLEQEEDKQDQAVSSVDRAWEILQAGVVAPTSGEELAVTGKSSVGRYPCPTRVQIQGNAEFNKGSDRGIALAPSIHAPCIILARTHTPVSIHHSYMELMPSPPVSRMNMWPKSGHGEQHIPLASVTGLGIGT